MTRQIVLASGNAGKLAEIQNALADFGVELISQKSLGVIDAIENGLSFVENAIIKARHAATITGLPALADDSGLEVDFLNGAPGIYSARYAGENANDATNNQKLLDALKNVPAEQRSARFVCVLVYMRHANDPMPLICQGSWQGRILEQAEGEGGFGYDPLFFVPDLNLTAARLSKTEKNAISHRGQALSELKARFIQ
jgi:XTP/dITP diphosphohydrolase